MAEERVDTSIQGHSSLKSIAIVVTRPRDQARQMVELLEKQGARIIICPCIEIQPPPDLSELKQAIRDRATYDWVVFTSVNGVRFFSDCVLQMKLDPVTFQVGGRPHFAAIGPATAELAEQLGFSIELVPHKFVAESLLETIISRHNSLEELRFLLPRADRARPLLLEQLREKGAFAHEIVTYITRIASEMPVECRSDLLAGRADLVTFTSSSTVEGFFTMLHNEKIDIGQIHLKIASIGPITSQTLRNHGVEPAIEAREYTIPGLVSAIIEHYRT